MRLARASSVAVVLLLTLAPALLASEPSRSLPAVATVGVQGTTAPPRITAAPMSLADAVDFTLRYDPRVQTGRQETSAAYGRFQEASGFFDPLVRVRPAYSFQRLGITDFQQGQEVLKRQFLLRLSDEMGRVTLAIQDNLNNNRLTPPPCPRGIDFITLRDSALEGDDQATRTGIAYDDMVIVIPLDIASDAGDVFQFCLPSTQLQTPQESGLEFLRDLNRIANLNLDQVVATGVQAPRELLLVARDVSSAVTTRARLAYDRLGVISDIENTKTASLGLGYFKPFRFGLRFSADFRLQSRERNFKDKPLDPAFGGLGIRNEFPSFATVTVQIPLGKGRGGVSTAAPERATRLAFEAQRDQLRHTMAEEVFATVVAYVNLQAAQQSLALLEESAASQARLVSLTEQLVRAGESPVMELDRARARAAAVNGGVAGGKQAVSRSRLFLAEAIGIDVDTLSNAPLANENYPDSTGAPASMDPLIRRALAERRDLRALDQTRAAASVLASAARADLKRRFDFTVRTGFSTLYESPFFRFLPDEQDQPPTSTPVGYDSPRGYWRSVGGAWEPFASAQLTWVNPFGNNQARGRSLQQESQLTTSDVSFRDRERLVRQSVVQLVGTLTRASQAVGQRKEAVTRYEQTLRSALARYETGDITLIDLLLTEEELTREKLELVRAFQTYRSLLARLKFETGELVTFRQEAGTNEVAQFGGLSLVP